MHGGIDVEATKAAIADDEFSRARAKDPEPEPWSTVSRWEQIQRGRAAGEEDHEPLAGHAIGSAENARF